jgi:hypothetical protein
MVRRGDFTGRPDEAREYLANLLAAGEWSAAKPLDQYQDSQVMRKANAFRVQERAGVEISNKAARGHADILPTRPTVPTQRPIPGQPSLPARTRKDVMIIPPPKFPQERIDGPRGSYQLNTTRFRDVIYELKGLEKSRPDAKVYFSLWDNRRGAYRKMYVEKGKGKAANNGVNVRELVSRIREKVKRGQAKTEREGLLDAWGEDIEGGVAGDNTPDDLELPEVFTSIGVHVMGGW